VTTLVKKDGKELSAEDQKKKNDKTRKRIEELQSAKPRKSQGRKSPASREGGRQG